MMAPWIAFAVGVLLIGIIDGQIGLRGMPGSKREKRDVGFPELHCVLGIRGQKGERGDRGIPGRDCYFFETERKGQKGEPSFTLECAAPGLPGIMGLPGERGYRGEPGPPGLPGLPGLMGEKGDTGSLCFSATQTPPALERLRDRTCLDNSTAVLSKVKELQGKVTDLETVMNAIQNPLNKRARLLTRLERKVNKTIKTGLSPVPGPKREKRESGFWRWPCPPGVPGEKGERGDLGFQGKGCMRGPKGQKGELRLMSECDEPMPGLPGLYGDFGPKGYSGARGPDGIPGIPGPAGRKGNSGFLCFPDAEDHSELIVLRDRICFGNKTAVVSRVKELQANVAGLEATMNAMKNQLSQMTYLLTHLGKEVNSWITTGGNVKRKRKDGSCIRDFVSSVQEHDSPKHKKASRHLQKRPDRRHRQHNSGHGNHRSDTKVTIPRYSKYREYTHAICDVEPNTALKSELQQDVRGRVTLWQKNSGGPLNIYVDVGGFSVGDSNGHQGSNVSRGHRHGFHIHEYGDDLSNGCQSAGPHYNPLNANHGGPDSSDRHTGDLGMIDCDDKGISKVIFADPIASLTGKYSIIGRALVIHANSDDYGVNKADPESLKTGKTGVRIACCVIQRIDRLSRETHRSIRQAKKTS